MKDTRKVYIDRIREDEPEEINETLAPLFMDIQEKEMRFESPVTMEGEASVTDDWLILRLNIQTQVELVCSYCNEEFTFDIDIQDLVHDEPLENIRDGTLDILPIVRENILLAVPFYPQCGITVCKRRKEIEPYLKKATDSQEKAEEGNNPFKDLL